MAELVGVHCAFEECRQLDFLPFECEACGERFCASHRTPDSHACQGGGGGVSGSDVPRDSFGKVEFESCAFSECAFRGVASTLTLCRCCERRFCVSHRVPDVHRCEADSLNAESKRLKDAFVQRTLQAALGEEAAGRIARRREELEERGRSGASRVSDSRAFVAAPKSTRALSSQLLIERLKVKTRATACRTSSPPIPANSALPLKVVLPELSDTAPLKAAPLAWIRAVEGGGLFLCADKSKPLGVLLDRVLRRVGLPLRVSPSLPNETALRWGLRRGSLLKAPEKEREERPPPLDLQLPAGSQLEAGDCVELFFQQEPSTDAESALVVAS